MKESKEGEEKLERKEDTDDYLDHEDLVAENSLAHEENEN